MDLAGTAARTIAVYLLMLVVMRVLGKREVGNFSAFDLIVALVLGEVAGEIINGGISLAEGGLAILIIAAAQTGNAWLTWWGHGFDTLLEGRPTVVVRNGRLDAAGMRAERMGARDVMSHLRAVGITELRDVKLAIVEDDGSVSVIRTKQAEPATKADVTPTSRGEQ